MFVVLADVFADALSGAPAVLVAFTGLFAGAAHYAALLTGRTTEDIDRATGFGFFLGFAFGILALIVDALL